MSCILSFEVRVPDGFSVDLRNRLKLIWMFTAKFKAIPFCLPSFSVGVLDTSSWSLKAFSWLIWKCNSWQNNEPGSCVARKCTFYRFFPHDSWSLWIWFSSLPSRHSFPPYSYSVFESKCESWSLSEEYPMTDFVTHSPPPANQGFRIAWAWLWEWLSSIQMFLNGVYFIFEEKFWMYVKTIDLY